MTSSERKSSSSIATGIRSSRVDSEESFRMAEMEARKAEKERILASQQRKSMLESLRASVTRKYSTGIDRKERKTQVIRLIRDGTAAAVDRETRRILRMVKTLKHKRELSRTAEELAHLFTDKVKVFVDKKKLLERLEKKLDLLCESSLDQSGGEESERSVKDAPQLRELELEKLRVFAKCIHTDLERIMSDLLSVYERLENQLESDAREDENTQRFFYACISCLDDNARRQIIDKCHAASRNASVEERRAIRKKVIESLAKTNRKVAERIHSLARKKAREFLKEERPGDAVTELGAAIRIWRDDAATYRLLFTALSQEGEERGATVALQEVLRLCPDDLPVRKRVAQRWEKLGEEDRAIAEYEEVIARVPTDYETIRKLGGLLFKKEQFSRVTQVLSDYVRRFPEDMKCHFWMGASWYQLGAPAKAVPFLKTVASAFPERQEPTHLLVLAYRDLEMFDEAMALHEKHMRLLPDCPRAHVLQGSLFRTCGDLPQTETEFRTAIEQFGSTYSLLLNLGRTQAEMGRFEEAIHTLEEAAQKNGEQSEVFLELGKALRRQGEYERAKEALKKAIEINENEASSRQELSMVYIETGKWELAKEVLQPLAQRSAEEDLLKNSESA